MASKNQNLSSYNPESVPNAQGMRFGIVCSEWNSNITDALLQGAINTLTANGVSESDILVARVPGSFELIYGASQMVKKDVDAVIAIGCVIRGDTPHFDYICVVYGLITTNTMEQAVERCGGKHGNKGDECAITAIKMIDFHNKLS